ncbi:hypothetical protein [Pelagibacterium halotolerans]|uniref:Uncharacterized protein n=1 Tax=Pelagibacterium halotolerans (strain DSM 22347 / JCM 15775 / CGMCC 1.7692 / B2) TaxID=1082931 RepID=G4RDE9_PELHB|nr:hypothetical protein [Pelagibacterium halotolerans]AEQ50775.1 hypothetical protein KKY_736 [Pelagibacterium halotolerans B2]QJR19308.1 hypothetical protein HKM20_13180 [Pelagibacterium halotolerans]SDZ95530.1 hypothetical protein SAMN05428936_101662 [Pelagibacterium halotolerans]
MKSIVARAAAILWRSRQFDTAEIAMLLGEPEAAIASVVCALATIEEEVLEIEVIEAMGKVRT